MSSAKWLRYFRLVVATDGSKTEALDLSDFRCVFKISQAVIGKPCTAEITVYNVAKSTVDRIQVPTNAVVGSKRLRVIIEAGYQNDHSVIFQGDLWWKSVGRESETETFMRLVAASGDRAHQYAVVNASIPKGASQEEVFSAVAASFAEKGVPTGSKPTLMTTKLPRGKVLYAMSADAMQGIADTNGFDWGYTSSGLVAIRKDQNYDPTEEVIVLNSKTGMLGRPMLTVEGVEVESLLLPKADIGTLVQIDNRSIQRENYDTSVSQGAMQTNMAVTDDMISADGLYRVVGREHSGDTRGNEWRTKLVCFGVNAAQQPLTPTSLNNIPNL